MIVVSNASPLINLARIGRLLLLRDLYGQLTIPEAVWNEVVIEGKDQPGASEIEAATWIRRKVATDNQLVRILQQDLDDGEAEAIALAVEEEADLLLMDERIGRESANHLGLRYVGLVGVLVEAKSKALVREIKPLLDALRDIAGFRLSEDLYSRVLKDQGEN